jgi:NAD+ synthase (glutamine-hydrolysing)
VTRSLRVAGAQLDLIVGDLSGNESKIRRSMEWAQENQADVLVLPELAISGYPPEDLVLRRGFIDENLAVLARLAAESGSVATVVGFIDRLDQEQMDDDAVGRSVTNAAAVIANGEIKDIYHKSLLPTYGVFDEGRLFAEGRKPLSLHSIAGVVNGISICEDIWDSEGPPTGQSVGGADVLLNINGSPYHIGKSVERLRMLTERAEAGNVHVVYVNAVGGQDELVFDGASMVIAPDGTLVHRSPQFVEHRFLIDISIEDHRSTLLPLITVTEAGPGHIGLETSSVAAELDEFEEIYEALCAGLFGYVTKNGFREVVISLSGGIDSALSAAIATDALGPESIRGFTMPTRYSSDGSVDDSYELAERLGIRIDTIPIEGLFEGFLDALDPVFAGTPVNVAEENLQARIRGTIMMAISNKFGGMVLATGNKSEMAVGYATLYGDMAGGYSVLKDVYKTMVYDLSRWRNSRGEVIPQAIIDKEPSAELRPDQLDSDSLPPYPILDEILRRYIELDMTADEIVEAGFDDVLTHRVATMVDRNEYKRRQSAPGVRITPKAFGRDRRLPITNWFRP